MLRFDTIFSRDNKQVKLTVKLLSSAKHRKETGLFVLEGIRLCHDALQTGVKIESLFYTPLAKGKYFEQVGALTGAADNVYETDGDIFAKLSDTASPQGVLCLCRLPALIIADEDIKTGGKYLALEDISDPSNLGAMARTAEALGIDGMILSKGCTDPYGPKAMRASMGSLLRIPVSVADDLPRTITALQNRGIPSFAAVPAAGAQPANTLDFRKGGIMAIGNEAGGLTEKIISVCETCVTIPMAGRAESLNAAAAAAILMWEMVR